MLSRQAEISIMKSRAFVSEGAWNHKERIKDIDVGNF